MLFIKYIFQFFLGALSPNSCKFLVIFFRFSPLKGERILRIVVGGVESPDRMVWQFTKNGAFTVQSCYHRILKITHDASMDASTSGPSNESGSWECNMIWSIHLLLKVKMFTWARRSILPTMAELFEMEWLHLFAPPPPLMWPSILHLSWRHLGVLWDGWSRVERPIFPSPRQLFSFLLGLVDSGTKVAIWRIFSSHGGYGVENMGREK